MSDFVSDVRSSSADARYVGKPFQGAITQAKRQARMAPAYAPPNEVEAIAAGVSLARYELLKFLRLIP